MASSTIPTSLENTGLTQAPFLIGVMGSSVLLGIAGAQVVYYFRTYPGDMRFLKVLVASLFLLDLIHQVLMTQTIYMFYISAKLPENMKDMIDLPWTYTMSLAIQRIITGMVQMFYAWRMYSIGPKRMSKKFLVGTVLLFTFLQFCIGVVLVGRLIAHPALSKLHEPIRKIVYSIELCLAMLTDTLITVTLVYYLRRSRLGFGSTESVIDRLIHVTLNIGLLTCAISVVTFITYHTIKRSVVFSAFVEIISKIYVNSFLANLNSRRGVHLSNNNYDTLVLTTIILQESTSSYT